MKHIRVGVLRGGPSSEYDISLKTGSNVIKHISASHDPVDIFIDKEGTWHMHGLPVSPATAADRVDVFFNAMHGTYGEDGGVQHILDALHVPYTGSRRLASALSMHKVRAKELLKESGIKMPRHRLVRADEDPAIVTREVFQTMFLPLIVKPASSGSSLGVRVVDDFPSLARALQEPFAYGDEVIVEECVRGKEATVGVVDDFRMQTRYVLPLIEIKPPEDHFFDFEAKYNGKTQEICPGNFTKKEREEVQKSARLVHDTLGLRHYSRSDFIVSPRGVYFLEANTLPGLTEQSLLPKSIEAVGSTMPEFLGHVIEQSLHGK